MKLSWRYVGGPRGAVQGDVVDMIKIYRVQCMKISKNQNPKIFRKRLFLFI